VRIVQPDERDEKRCTTLAERNLYAGRNEGDLEGEDTVVPATVEPIPGTVL
jgi:hypothetical protein